MKLNETFQTDLAAFFNPDEFAIPSIINGKSVLIVHDDDSLQAYNFKAEGEGLAVGELLFHVPVASLEEKPFIDQRMNVGKIPYRIIDIKQNLGVYTITLEGYHS